jgi:hypothetical protein
MKEKNFLDFVKHLTDICCPWHKSVVAIYATYIEVTFVTSTMVRPSDLGWLNTHAVGGEWFVTSEDNETHIVVRFHENDEEL